MVRFLNCLHVVKQGMQECYYYENGGRHFLCYTNGNAQLLGAVLM